MSASAIANLLHRARMPWILDPCDSWLWDVPKIQTLAAELRTAWALADVLHVRVTVQRAYIVFD